MRLDRSAAAADELGAVELRLPGMNSDPVLKVGQLWCGGLPFLDC
jgi:hypothetical protein